MSSELGLTCVPVLKSAQNSGGTVFMARFIPTPCERYLRQDWVCGDTQGTYSRNYQSLQYYVPPFRVEDGPWVCRANEHTVKAQFQWPAHSMTQPQSRHPPASPVPGAPLLL